MAPARPLGATPRLCPPPTHQRNHHPDCYCHRLILPVVTLSVHRVRVCTHFESGFFSSMLLVRLTHVTQGSSFFTAVHRSVE